MEASKLTGLTPGVAGDMTIAGKNTLTVKNVAVGEVWVCSGQSNMEFVAQVSARTPRRKSRAANLPEIRMFTVAKAPAAEPQDDCTGKWEVCTPETVGALLRGRLLLRPAPAQTISRCRSA